MVVILACRMASSFSIRWLPRYRPLPSLRVTDLYNYFAPLFGIFLTTVNMVITLFPCPNHGNFLVVGLDDRCRAHSVIYLTILLG